MLCAYCLHVLFFYLGQGRGLFRVGGHNETLTNVSGKLFFELEFGMSIWYKTNPFTQAISFMKASS